MNRPSLNMGFRPSVVLTALTSSRTMLAVCMIAAGFLVSSCQTASAQSDAKLIFKSLQDQPMQLPLDNTVAVSAQKRNFSVDFQYYADTAAPSESMLTLVTPDNRRIDIEPDASGNYVVYNPMEGLYGLLAQTANGIASIPFYVSDVSPDAAVLPAPDEMPISVMVAHSSHLSVPLMRQSRDTVVELARRYGSTAGASTPIPPIQYDFVEAPSHQYQVRQRADGSIQGEVMVPVVDDRRHTALANNNIHLLQNGKVINRQVCAEDGTFVFNSTPPGVYGIVAVGPGGYTAFEFEVLPGDAFASQSGDANADGKLVAAQAPAASFPIMMIPPEQAATIIEAQNEGEDPPQMTANADAPMGGGGGGYGGGGGFGGGGGGGLLAALALAAAAIGNDNNNNPVVVPPPVSPASP